MKRQRTSIITLDSIAMKIYKIRGVKVMLDSDLAYLYRVKTKMLNRAVKRNIKRFPKDFMFKLTGEEFKDLRCQIGTSSGKCVTKIVKSRAGGRRYRPYAFTENGVAMLSSVLNSDRAIKVNIQIMRTFTKLRYILSTNSEIKRKIEELESRVEEHDEKFKIIIGEIRKLFIQEAEDNERQIGFRVNK
jgi:hypothetical protein